MKRESTFKQIVMRRLLQLVLLAGGIGAVVANGYALQNTSGTSSSSDPCPSSEKRAAGANSGSVPQSSTQDKPGQSPCKSEEKEPSAAEKFPFPGSEAAAPLPGSQSQPYAPLPHRPSAAEEHPFPGSAPPMPDSSSSNSSGGYSSSRDGNATPDQPDTPPADDQPKSGRRHLPRVEKLQSDEDRADEDLKVSKFYEEKGNLYAAYLRARDAVKFLPSDSETHYAVARLAQKLNKREEAIAEYNLYLKIEPDGEYIKQAHQALHQLAAN